MHAVEDRLDGAPEGVRGRKADRRSRSGSGRPREKIRRADGRGLRAERDAHADLLAALGDREGEDAVDPDRREQRGQPAEGAPRAASMSRCGRSDSSIWVRRRLDVGDGKLAGRACGPPHGSTGTRMARIVLGAHVERERAELRVLQVGQVDEGPRLLRDLRGLAVADDRPRSRCRAGRLRRAPSAIRAPSGFSRRERSARAIVSLITATFGAPASSDQANSRPATSGMPSVAK